MAAAQVEADRAESNCTKQARLEDVVCESNVYNFKK